MRRAMCRGRYQGRTEEVVEVTRALTPRTAELCAGSCRRDLGACDGCVRWDIWERNTIVISVSPHGREEIYKKDWGDVRAVRVNGTLQCTDNTRSRTSKAVPCVWETKHERASSKLLLNSQYRVFSVTLVLFTRARGCARARAGSCPCRASRATHPRVRAGCAPTAHRTPRSRAAARGPPRR